MAAKRDGRTMKLSYDSPAEPDSWSKRTLPLGNGRLGCMVFGDPVAERVQFNVDSLWLGDGNPSGAYKTMGAYQNFGDMHVEMANGGLMPDQYLRELDIMEGVHAVTFTYGCTTHRREVFASAPAQVIVMRYDADAPGDLSGQIRCADAHGSATRCDGGDLCFEGALENGLRYAARGRVLADGGAVACGGGVCRFERCDSLTVILAAATNYVQDGDRGWRGGDPAGVVKGQVDEAARRTYEELKREHVADVASYMGRTWLELGGESGCRRGLTTDERLEMYGEGVPDCGLEALLFQYGRYLLQASSRPGSLPPNLQGIWNDSNTPAFHCDYHTNINIQMNYWPAEPANLADCHTAFFGFMQSQIPAWRSASQAEPAFHDAHGDVRGWGLRVSHNIFGGMGWRWDKTASAWYCLHLWEHYAFGRDRCFLEQTAYPIMKEVCGFLEGQMKTLPDGSLVIPDGWSPEHGPDEDGVSYSQQIAWELFNAAAVAAEELGDDSGFRDRALRLRDALAGQRIGRWGQLQEWIEDRDDPLDRHRHTSHLFALYPGTQITRDSTPELVEAAAVSLAARGDFVDDGAAELATDVSVAMRSDASDSFRSWTWPWRCALWARLGDAERAYGMVRGLLKHNTLPSMLTNHPPFQIDGNLGVTAAMCEMLLQSHQGWIELLPALPEEWSDGKVYGLRARGGFEVDIEWHDGRLLRAEVRAGVARRCEIRYNDKNLILDIPAGARCKLGKDIECLGQP